jgi:hypothetical protein
MRIHPRSIRRDVWPVAELAPGVNGAKQFTGLHRPFEQPKNDFCCVPFLNRGPKEDGGRNAKVFARGGQMVRCGAGFLPSPLLYGGSGNGKIVHQEQSGEPTRMQPNHLPARCP